MYDDMKLKHTDPLYMNILSSFRGYNDDEFKDAGKGFIDDLSSHCLDYAKERGILPSSVVANSGLKFRFATEMDETMLVALSEKVCFMIDIIIAGCICSFYLYYWFLHSLTRFVAR
jgi:hypothetical protein